MKNLQDLLDRAHTAAGVSPQRSFDTGEHFEEDKPDSIVQAHMAELQKKADADVVRRQVCLGMHLLLSAADNLSVLDTKKA